MLGGGRLPEEAVMVQICREMGWTYQEFQNQPSWFIDLLIELRNLEEKEHEKRMKMEELKLKTKQIK
jgi:hypothetical protein